MKIYKEQNKIWNWLQIWIYIVWRQFESADWNRIYIYEW